MAKNNEQKITTAMLAFSRSIEISEAMMYGRSGDLRIPVAVEEKGVRGQSSHAKPNKDTFNPGKSNPQVVDAAMLPVECDQLEISFFATFLSNSMQPSSSDDSEVVQNLQRLASEYATLGGYSVLAERYLGNIANGRFAWRNRTVTRDAAVTVKFDGEEVTFDPYKLSLESVPARDDIKNAVVKASLENAVDVLVDRMAEGLTGEPFAIAVEWLSKVSPGSEVYPSQEYVREDVRRKNVSRHLSFVKRVFEGEAIRCATLHSQKIGAAIRCIDDWHDHPEFMGVPVPVNPYAGVQEANIALRHGTEASSFFDLAKKPKDLWKAVSDGALTDDFHFYIANLVRGGVYGS